MDYTSNLKLKNQNANSNSGFTLLELVLAIAVLSIVSGMIAAIIIRTGVIFEKQTGQVEVGVSNRFVLDEIAKAVRTAKQIEEDFTGNGQNFTTSTTTAILKIPSINATGEIIAGVFDRVVFSLEQDKIYKRVYPDGQSTRKKTSQILTAATKTLNFTYNNQNLASSSAVTVDLTTIKRLPSGNQENTDKIEVVLRNY